MTSILKWVRARFQNDHSKDIIIEDDQVSEKPYLLSSLFYILVVLFIGLPMWFYTCSKMRYSLPDLAELDINLHRSPLKLHLEISVIQMSRFDALKADEEFNDPQTEYLRSNLPATLYTSIENITYDINWRVRRPTQKEYKIIQSHQMANSLWHDNDRSSLIKLEEDLIRIHKPTNKFKLFMYLIEDKYQSAFCNPMRSHTYTISFERFIYLCPSNILETPESNEPVVNLIRTAIQEIYSNTIDLNKIRHILSKRIDLLFSLVPETTNDLQQLSVLADKVHKIYDLKVRDEFSDLQELVNISPITQYLVDLLQGNLISQLVEKSIKNSEANETVLEPRKIRIKKVAELFRNFESRLSKHSSLNVHNILVLLPDSNKSSIIFEQKEISNTVSILEGQDTSTMMIVNNDKYLFLGMRAVIRRVAGMSSAELCKSCLVRREVFFNKWEVDAALGVLTLIKLQSIFISLVSMSQQMIGVKIPKDVSLKAHGAYVMALNSIDHLKTKRVLSAYRLASEAYEISESAYYDPSLLESLYFPDDLKYAIYLPLFLPLFMPFLSSAYRLMRYSLIASFKVEQKIKIN